MADDPTMVIITKYSDFENALSKMVQTIFEKIRNECGQTTKSDNLLLSSRQIEEIYGIKKSLLHYWRTIGTGPAYTNVGRRIFYNRNDFEEFIASGRIQTMPQNGDEDTP